MCTSSPLIRSAAALLLAASALDARAANPLGFYVGAGIGQASVKVDHFPSGTPGGLLGFDENHTGWKMLVGIRPVSFVAAELEYVDSGKATTTIGVLQADARIRGPAVFGLAYLPLHLPVIDVYGKIGLSRLQTTAHGLPGPGLVCVAAPCSFDFDRSDTRFAWGLGAQAKLSALAIRAEYERLGAPDGNPEFLSLALTWSF